MSDGRSYEDWCRLVRGTSISPKTLLATDYLNHFNEAVMLIGMLPGMPEMIEDCRVWAPLSYQEHFARSNFAGRAGSPPSSMAAVSAARLKSTS